MSAVSNSEIAAARIAFIKMLTVNVEQKKSKLQIWISVLSLFLS